MGLDMYLYACNGVSGSSFASDDDRGIYTTLVKLMGLDKLNLSHHAYASFRIGVAYWRKANAIHKWFVDNVQDGEDNCGYYYVSREQLQELVDLCKKVIASRDKPEQGEATRELEPASGFFFGSTDIDDAYFDDLTSTINQIEPLLVAPELENFSFEYHSSW